MKKLNKKGFTIVELVIVIAVIAILAAVLIPTFTTVIDKANKSAAMQECRNAWTEFLAEDKDNIIAQYDAVLSKGDKYFFAVINGSFTETVYASELEALKVAAEDSSAAIGDTTGQYTATEKASTPVKINTYAVVD